MTLEAAHPACLRWCVNTGAWQPDGGHEGDEWRFLLKLLPKHDQEAVMRFVRLEDKKKALVSRLLQRRCVEKVLGIEYDQIRIDRTREGKPFLANPVEGPSAPPNFNFNATHHGSFVALASEPLCLAGVDVMVHETRRTPQTIQEYMKSFTSCFTDHEWRLIWGAGTEGEQYDQFYRLWCCKEAYIKAVGVGLGFELERVEFHMKGGDPWAKEASLKIDGEAHSGWRLHLHALGEGHWACVARGPPGEAIESYRRTLPDPDTPAGPAFGDALDAPCGPFEMLMVGDLVPEALRSEYEDAGGETL